MKVLFLDPLNTQNNFYIYSKYLRQYGVDAEVVMDSKFVPKDSLPSWHDSETYEWIHYLDLPYFIPFKNPVKYIVLMKRLIDFANKFDVIVCSGLAPLWMRYANKPFTFFSYGSDLDQMAVKGWSGSTGQKFNILGKMVNIIIKYALVSALRKAKSTVIAPYQIGTAQKVGLKNLCFLPHIIDIDTFKPLDNREQERKKLRDDLKCDFIVFHPPRQAWVDRTVKDCKGNDKVFRAFRRFTQIYQGRAKLIVVEKGWDVDESKRLIKELGITDSVCWMASVPKSEMCKLYNASDVALDQFGVGVLALVAIEAMACGTPAMTYVTQSTEDNLYPVMPPIINVHSEDEILHNLCVLARDGSNLGKQGRKWVELFCSPQVAVSKHIEFLRNMIDKWDTYL
jgi:glycosyltransferase involved in cell wall biosynthesis